MPTSPQPTVAKEPRSGAVRPTLDAVTTIRDDGSRRFLHPADVRGRFTLARRLSGWALIAIYLALPWIKIGGHPAVFLDVASRRFHLFGGTLAFQDAWLLFFAITGLGFSLFFLTALLGRVWCGWACPQTVFLDHLFRRVERWIEGDAPKRRALDAAPWNARKAARRVFKHTIYILLSLGIAHLFLAYFVSLPRLWSMVHTAPGEHLGAFAFVFLFGGVLYFNFAWFREQLCLIICPYGRLQSALIDDHSVIIGYDTGRGDPPSQKLRRPGPRRIIEGLTSEALAKDGDCIDCLRCVQVCPTGIDIRQGLQMECIGCVACVDACDAVMTKLNRPRGLIRYDSLAAFAGGRTRWVRPRTVAYAVLMLIGAAVATWAFSTVRPATLEVTRMAGAPYFVDADSVRNQFLVRLVNKRHTPLAITLELPDAPAGLQHSDADTAIVLSGLDEQVRPLVVQVPREGYRGPFHLRVEIRDADGTFSVARAIEFVGPDARLLHEEEERRED